MNIRSLLFYLSLFVNKKERKIQPVHVVKTLALKKLNRGIKKITNDFKRTFLIPLFVNQTNNDDYNDIFILNLVKTVTE